MKLYLQSLDALDRLGLRGHPQRLLFGHRRHRAGHPRDQPAGPAAASRPIGRLVLVSSLDFAKIQEGEAFQDELYASRVSPAQGHRRSRLAAVDAGRCGHEVCGAQVAAGARRGQTGRPARALVDYYAARRSLHPRVADLLILPEMVEEIVGLAALEQRCHAAGRRCLMRVCASGLLTLSQGSRSGQAGCDRSPSGHGLPDCAHVALLHFSKRDNRCQERHYHDAGCDGQGWWVSSRSKPWS